MREPLSDGTKIKANASRHKAMNDARMQQSEAELKKQIDALLARAKVTDEADTERGRGDNDRRPRGGRYKREFGVPEAKAQDNFTDPHSRMKRAGGGFDPSDNAQTTVDEAARISTSSWWRIWTTWRARQLAAANDRSVQDNVGALPALGLADVGYHSEDILRNAPINLVIVALGHEGKQHAHIDPVRLPHTAAMAAKTQPDEGRAAYRKRKGIAEPSNAWIKSVLGFRQFSLRGLERVCAEWKLACTALNLRRMTTQSHA